MRENSGKGDSHTGLMDPTVKEREAEKSKSEDAPKSRFQKDDRILKKEKVMPNGIYFGSVETARSEDLVEEGRAYIYFTSDGLVERSVVQLTNRKEVTWSLIVNPLTGHADILQKAIRLQDATQE